MRNQKKKVTIELPILITITIIGMTLFSLPLLGISP